MNKIVEYFTSHKDWLTEKTYFCPNWTELLAILKKFLLGLTYKSKIRLHMHIVFVQKCWKKGGTQIFQTKMGGQVSISGQ